MLKGALLDFFYGWARYMLVLMCAGGVVLAILQGEFFRMLALFAAAALLFKLDHSEPEKREMIKVGLGLVLMLYGLSGVTLPGG